MSTATIAPSASQIAEFHEQGFVLFRGLFKSQEIARMGAAFDRMDQRGAELSAATRPAEPGNWAVPVDGARYTFQSTGAIRHIAWCGALEPELAAVARDPRLLEIAAALLGSRRMAQLINQAHYKMPGSDVVFDWHQDSAHRGIDSGGFVDVNGRGSYVQTAIAIDGVTAENGPLALIPGSNRQGHLPHAKSALLGPVDASRAVAPTLEPGDVLAFGPYTIHGSQANRSARARRSFLNGYAFPGANQRRYTGHEHGAGQEFAFDG